MPTASGSHIALQNEMLTVPNWPAPSLSCRLYGMQSLYDDTFAESLLCFACSDPHETSTEVDPSQFQAAHEAKEA